MLDPNRWPDADALLERALALPPDARRVFVREQAGQDPELLSDLEAVLTEAELEDDPALAPGGGLNGTLFDDLCQKLGTEPEPPALPPGGRVGPYEVVAHVGRGGMGEVYRARDQRLQRDVALKVLPTEVAHVPERLARLRREAQLLASLKHPRIAGIYDVVEEGPLTVLVLEFAEGSSLASRLAAGSLPVRDALRIARDIAEGLEAAHTRGIVHRDLKPSNVIVSDDQHAVVLDFGLAKVLAEGPAESEQAFDSELATTVRRAGAVVGTAPYMAPEQARGERVDHRADIWAFGCVLYEMLTGTRAFDGDSTTEILARVLERDPDLGQLPRRTPPAVRRLVRRCLQKDPARRLGYIGDAILDIDEGRSAPPALRLAPTGEVRLAPALAAVLVAAGLAVGAGAAVVGLRTFARDVPAAVTRLSVPLPDSDDVITGSLPGMALSPDGRTLVYRARREGVIQLFRRTLDDFDPVPLGGTENAGGPFFSPDGRWLAFDKDAVLMRMPIGGGPPVRIAEAPGGAAGSWMEGDQIVFSAGFGRVLQRVPASGGPAVPVTSIAQGDTTTTHTSPDVLPGGRAVVFTLLRDRKQEIAAAPLGGAVHDIRVLTEGHQPRYVEGGYLAFIRQGVLWAARFDPDRLELQSQPVPVLEGLHTGGAMGAAQYAVAGNGALVYAPRREESPLRRLVWIDRSGQAAPVDLEPRAFSRVSLSPDGSRVALSVADRDNPDVWVYDMSRGTLTRITFDKAADTAPVWTPDGRSIAFRSDRDGGGLFLQSAETPGQATRLTRLSGPIHTPYGFTPDGRALLFAEFHSYRHQRIGAVSMTGSHRVSWLLDGEFAQLRPQVSPDGRWLAYQSDESGRFEVYVRPYPEVNSRRWQVSTAGGTSPVWSRDGRELFFHSGSAMMVAPVGGSSTFSAGTPNRLFQGRLLSERLGPVYDLSPDGQRLLTIVEAGSERGTWARWHLMFVSNWVSELNQKLESKGSAASP